MGRGEGRACLKMEVNEENMGELTYWSQITQFINSLSVVAGPRIEGKRTK